MTKEEYNKMVYNEYLYSCAEMKKEPKTFEQFFNEMRDLDKEDLEEYFLEIKEASENE